MSCCNHDKECALDDPNWQDIVPNPNSFWTKASDTLGDGIDRLSSLIIRAVCGFGDFFIDLAMTVAGKWANRKK